MADLLKFPAKRCLTAAGVLIHQDKVLLVKHKKVGFWLCPGGHMEDNELPHQAAEREFWEETNIKVKSRPFGLMKVSQEVQAVPASFANDVHWVCQDNYEHRVNGKPLTEYALKHWKNGCEQHFNFMYLMEPVADVEFQENVEETDGIAWFTAEEVTALDTHEQIKNEVLYAFNLVKSEA